MKYRPLEEIADSLENKRVPYSKLMAWRVRRILLVSSLYDSFTFQEDGNLTEMLFSEYLVLNLRYAPIIIRVSTAEEAMTVIRNEAPDMVITMPRVGEMDVFEFGCAVRAHAPDLPLVMLAYDTRELALLQSSRDVSSVDRIFVWQGDARLFLAIIKWAEDRMNARNDAEIAGVRSILLIEDSIRFYSAYLPMLYTQIVEQTQALMAEGANRLQKLLRMRARPKVLLATCFEEGEATFRHYRDHMLGVITDARFPRGAVSDPQAGRDFVRLVKKEAAAIPVLLQSSDEQNLAVAAALDAAFINKRSQTLLHEVRGFLRQHLGFGDFVFRDPEGAPIGAAPDLHGLVEQLKVIPDESLLMHARRNDFSTWLLARTEYDLAKALRPIGVDEFATPGDLRQYLLDAVRLHRYAARAGLVAEFSSETFDLGCTFTRIGSGSLGGKGRGLAFINSLLNSYAIEDRIPDVRIFVPPSAVVASGVFDRFMDDANLTPLALGDITDEEVRRAFLAAPLPAHAVDALRAFLGGISYPLAVRSSSLLEDSSHQPFAGIYETFMLPNNHPDLEVRLAELCRAIRLVYASTYYADSKTYVESTPNRLEEEKMAVIVQQLVGCRHGDFLYPDLAGVARSYDYYPMKGLSSADGVASVALGLGRTVVEGERCVRFSPAQPQRLYQFASTRDYLNNSQRKFYALNLAAGSISTDLRSEPYLVQLGLEDALQHGTLEAVGSVYSPQNDAVYEGIHRPGVKLISMAGVLGGGRFPLPAAVRLLLAVGQAGFSCDVEIEFAVTLSPPGRGPSELAFLQIRPLVFGARGKELKLEGVNPRQALCISQAALGHGHLENIRDLVYIPEHSFDRSKTKSIAQEVGTLTAQLRREGRPFLLIGPGRWGSADPWLGIPVTWAQIAGVRCIVETQMAEIRVTPSQGSHFFQNITSFGIGYLTVNSPQAGEHVDFDWMDAQAAHSSTAHVRQLRFPDPLEIVIDGRSAGGVVMRPGETLADPSG